MQIDAVMNDDLLLYQELQLQYFYSILFFQHDHFKGTPH